MSSSAQQLEEARRHISEVQRSLENSQVQLEEQYTKLEQQFPKAEGSEKITIHTLLQYTKKRQHELTALLPSPYFARCDILSPDKDMCIYVGKFSYPEQSVVSWISPVATLRFAEPGKAFYTLPDRTKKEILLTRKDAYMIADGEVIFFSTEGINAPKTLIFQKHFSNRKTGFMLPEIVARMEEAQDKVIRSSWRGPLVISGPAGSGKTTLALHRVAYLMQVPEIKENFPGHRVRVFVQDEGTKSYFSSLLPELGIDTVGITTFQSWAYDILGLTLTDKKIELQPEWIEDAITHQKIVLLRTNKTAFTTKPLDYLLSLYQNNIQNNLETIQNRIEQVQLDDVDLTILLQAYKRNFGSLHESREYLVQQKKNFEVKRKMGRFDVSYNLCVVDEFQNYLPEQLQLIRGCMNEEMESLVYVGDMRQQTRFGTIHSWKEIGEHIDESRVITLEKVYRNTKKILEYIQSLGYTVSIPEALPEGTDVQKCEDTPETFAFITKEVIENNDRLIGILAKNAEDLIPYQPLAKHKHIKILTIREAQGVEFDTVFLVGNKKETWTADAQHYPPEIIEEKQKINKDLLYVALTRAMKELTLVGPILL